MQFLFENCRVLWIRVRWITDSGNCWPAEIPSILSQCGVSVDTNRWLLHIFWIFCTWRRRVTLYKRIKRGVSLVLVACLVQRYRANKSQPLQSKLFRFQKCGFFVGSYFDGEILSFCMTLCLFHVSKSERIFLTTKSRIQRMWTFERSSHKCLSKLSVYGSIKLKIGLWWVLTFQNDMWTL